MAADVARGGSSLVDTLDQQSAQVDKLPAPFKIVLMDCNMPILNGFMTTR